ncbi:21291_t:CDS:2 [Entrophospora sp. SA101]|nr:1060_t:CDS:2 [Entrophospora sp. SA101]CAJ0747391.1 21291_t:CDS:2 [Entrophospora sp. SA101]
MEFPVISCNKIYKSKKITYSYDSTDEKIIETIKKNSMIPPLSYIERCIENLMEHEEDKRPLVNIPNFGAVGSKNDLHGSKSYMNVYDDILANSDEYLSSFSQSRLKTEILNSFPYNCIPNNFETFINTIDQMENEPLLTSNAKDTHVLPQQFKKSFKENYIKITSYNNLPAIKEENLKLKSSREHYINLHDKFKTLVGCMDNEENYNNEIKNPSKPKTKGRPKKRVYNKKSRK